MPMITTDQFLDLTYKWMCANLQDIESSWPQAGGWEAWAQVQITSDLKSAFPLLRVEHEGRVYRENPQQDRSDDQRSIRRGRQRAAGRDEVSAIS